MGEIVGAHERPIGARYDLTHLRALHRHLFQDVYPFAGDLRTVDLRKADDPGGWFYPAARLTQGADVTFAALAQDKHLRGRDREGFIAGLARHLDAVNHLHPFREGNGRTQRIFFSQLSGRAGYLLRWDRISAEENAAASRAGAGRLAAAAGTDDRSAARQDPRRHPGNRRPADRHPGPRGNGRPTRPARPDQRNPHPRAPSRGQGRRSTARPRLRPHLRP